MNGWTKWLVATLWSVLVLVIMFMGNVVKANDEKSVSKDAIIIEKIHKEDDNLRKEFKKDISLVITEQKVMREDMNEGFAKVNSDLTKVLVAIEKIKK